jgi:hypothetical protein
VIISSFFILRFAALGTAIAFESLVSFFRSEVFPAVKMFWAMTPCSLVCGYLLMMEAGGSIFLRNMCPTQTAARCHNPAYLNISSFISYRVLRGVTMKIAVSWDV